MRLKRDSKRFIQAMAGVALTAVVAGCGAANESTESSDDAGANNSATSGTKVSVGGTEIDVSTLAAAVPSSLALSIFPQTKSASLSLAEEVEDPNASKTVADKQKDQAKRLAGGSDVTCFNPNVFQQHKAHSAVSCYEFDSDMNPSKFADSPTGAQLFGTKDGTDGKGEACLVAFARSEVKDVVDRVDQAMELASGLVCVAKKEELDAKLDEDEDLDLTSVMSKGVGSKMKISAAKIARLKDDAEGLSVYHTVIEFTYPDGRVAEMNLVNSISADGQEQKGVVYFRRDNSGSTSKLALQEVQQQPPQGGHDSNNTANKNDLMSINYHRFIDDDGAPSMRAEARFAQIVKTIQPFDEAGLVNFAALPAEAKNSDVHAIKLVKFDMNPDTNKGSILYAMNPGGSKQESSRGLLYNTESTADGKLKGCGVSGATANVSIRAALEDPEKNSLQPVRYWHPRGAQNLHPDKDPRYSATGEGNAVTQQCFKQNDDGLYVIDTEKTTHERGYEVVETKAVKVEAPRPPKEGFKGELPPLPKAE